MENLYSDIYPESWWVLMPATELRPGTARKFDVLGRTLVVYRTESGKLAAMDRFCPHMGASLAEGKVVGERIVYPFHAWEYDTSGVCARIPYLDGKIPPGARVPVLPVIEHLGWIWLYHGEKPAFELPDMPEARDPRFWIHHKTQRFRMHPLVILENAAGLRHFRTVHRVDAKNIQWEILREEPHCFEFVVTQEVPTRRGSTVVMTQFLYPGASAIFGSLKVGRRLLARFIAAPMPVSREEIAFHLIVIGKGLPGYRRLLNPLYRWYLARKLYKGSTDDYGPVWQHQNPHRRKVLVEDDRLQQKFRQYYRSQLPGSCLAQAS